MAPVPHCLGAEQCRAPRKCHARQAQAEGTTQHWRRLHDAGGVPSPAMAAEAGSRLLACPALPPAATPAAANAAAEAYVAGVEAELGEVKQPAVLWGMVTSDAWDAAEGSGKAADDWWEASGASEADGVISFSDLPPLPPMADLAVAARCLYGVVGGDFRPQPSSAAAAAPAAHGPPAAKVCRARGVSLLKRFSPGDVLGNGFWPMIRDGLLDGMYAEPEPVAGQCGELLASMFTASVDSAPATAAEVLAGLLTLACMAHPPAALAQLKGGLLGMLASVGVLWRNAPPTVQDTLAVCLTRLRHLWAASGVWHTLLHHTWPREPLLHCLLLSGTLQWALQTAAQADAPEADVTAALTLLRACVLSRSAHRAVSGALQATPSSAVEDFASAVQGALAARAAHATQVVSVPASHPDLVQERDLDPWAVSERPLAGLALLREDAMKAHDDMNGLVCSVDPVWVQGVLGSGSAPGQLQATASALVAAAAKRPERTRELAAQVAQALILPPWEAATAVPAHK